MTDISFWAPMFRPLLSLRLLTNLSLLTAEMLAVSVPDCCMALVMPEDTWEVLTMEEEALCADSVFSALLDRVIVPRLLKSVSEVS